MLPIIHIYKLKPHSDFHITQMSPLSKSRMHKAGTKPSPFSPGNDGTGKAPLENTAHRAVYQLLKRSVKPQNVPVEPSDSAKQLHSKGQSQECQSNQSHPFLLGELGALFS